MINSDSNNKVLVTGVAGFLGTNLLAALLAKNYQVVGFDNLAHGRFERIKRFLSDRFSFIEGDVRDKSAVLSAIKDIDIIVHFAESKIPRYGSSLETLDVNVVGTENVLEGAAQCGAHVILGSTDEVYGKCPETSLNEESSLVMGHSQINRYSYGVSKMMAEHLTFAYREKHKIKASVLRFFGGYGPFQDENWQGGPQSVFISSSLKRVPLQIHGDGLQVRTFTDVDDLIRGTLLAIEYPFADGEVFNIAGTDHLNIINLAYLVWRLSGNLEKPNLEFVPYTDFSRNYEDVRNRVADISKAYYLLGYQPKVKIEDGLRRTIEWRSSEFKEHR